MTKLSILAATLMAATTPMALAQTPPPAGGEAPGMQERGEREMERGHHRRGGERAGGPRHRGYGGHGGLGGPGASFHIETAEGASVTVRCGEDAIADCIEAAQPLLESVAGWTITPDFAPLPPAEGEEPGLDAPLPGEPLPGDLPPVEGSQSGLDPAPDATGNGDGPPIETLGEEELGETDEDEAVEGIEIDGQREGEADIPPAN